MADTPTTLHQAARAREQATEAFTAEADKLDDAIRDYRRHLYLGCLVLDRTPADVLLALELGVPLLDDGSADRDEATFERAHHHFTAQLQAGLQALDARPAVDLDLHTHTDAPVLHHAHADGRHPHPHYEGQTLIHAAAAWGLHPRDQGGGGAAPDQAPASRVPASPPDHDEEQIARTLVAAQALADQTVDQAKQQARGMDDKAAAETLVGQAAQQAREITEVASARAAELAAGAKTRRGDRSGLPRGRAGNGEAS